MTGRPGSKYKIHHDYTILGYFGARPDSLSDLLYEIYDAEMNVVAEITIDSVVADFNAEQWHRRTTRHRPALYSGHRNHAGRLSGGSRPDQCTVASVRPVQTRQAPTANPLTGVPNMQTTTPVHVGLKC